MVDEDETIEVASVGGRKTRLWTANPVEIRRAPEEKKLPPVVDAI